LVREYSPDIYGWYYNHPNNATSEYVSYKPSTGGKQGGDGMFGTLLGIGAITTGIAGMVVDAFKGDGDSGRLEMPPEIEESFLQDMHAQLDQIDQAYQEVDELVNTLYERIDTVRGYYEGLIPDQEAMKRLAEQDLRIAERFGEQTLEAIGSGFLREEDRKAGESIREATEREYRRMVGLAETNRVDPVVKQEWEDARRALERRLRQQLGPNWRLSDMGRRALERFEREKSLAFGQSAEQYRATQTALAQQRLGAYAGGIQTAAGVRLAGRMQTLREVQEMNRARQMALLGARNATATGAGGLAQLAGLEYTAGMKGVQLQGALRGEGRNIYTVLGTTKWSKDTKKQLEQGMFGGPGEGRFAQTQKHYERQQSYNEKMARLLSAMPEGFKGTKFESMYERYVRRYGRVPDKYVYSDWGVPYGMAR